MSLLRIAVVLGPLVAAALVRWWLARSAVPRGPQRWLLWVPLAGSAVVALRSALLPGRRAAVLAGAIAASYLALAIATFALLVEQVATAPDRRRPRAGAVRTSHGMAGDAGRARRPRLLLVVALIAARRRAIGASRA